MEIQEIEREKVKEFIKTLTKITDFKTLKKGDKIFNKDSLSVDFVSTFDHVEYNDGVATIYYKNCIGLDFHSNTAGYWYYYK
jgi:FKBP-type peptidyl-prolyl cis-trans isomerase (trigger factor)